MSHKVNFEKANDKLCWCVFSALAVRFSKLVFHLHCIPFFIFTLFLLSILQSSEDTRTLFVSMTYLVLISKVGNVPKYVAKIKIPDNKTKTKNGITRILHKSGSKSMFSVRVTISCPQHDTRWSQSFTKELSTEPNVSGLVRSVWIRFYCFLFFLITNTNSTRWNPWETGLSKRRSSCHSWKMTKTSKWMHMYILLKVC